MIDDARVEAPADPSVVAMNITLEHAKGLPAGQKIRLSQAILTAIKAAIAAADRVSPDNAAAVMGERERLGEDDAKFLEQVATMWSRNDGDPPESEGIWALKLRGIAATIRLGEGK